MGARKDPKKKQEQDKLVILRKQAIELRVKGLTYREISEQMGCAQNTAWLYVRAALKEARDSTKETAEDLRDLETSRLDKMYRNLEEKRELGDPKAIDSSIRISKRRSEITGIDISVKQEVNLRVEEVFDPEQIARMAKYLNAPKIEDAEDPDDLEDDA